MSGAGHWHWSKRGEYVTPAGYVRVRTPDGYKVKARVVMEKKLGRPLKPTEQVKYRDGDPLNTRPGNLYLAGRKTGPRRAHRTASRPAGRAPTAASRGTRGRARR